MADTRVGDTITDDRKPVTETLPGFRPAIPVVFCGLFPVDAAQFEDLRAAMGRLRLNDASFSYEMETSAALGFGFRCGFLGLLHLEIIQERLEREFNLDLIATAPSVIYKMNLRDGKQIEIHNPVDMPDPMKILRQINRRTSSHRGWGNVIETLLVSSSPVQLRGLAIREFIPFYFITVNPPCSAITQNNGASIQQEKQLTAESLPFVTNYARSLFIGEKGGITMARSIVSLLWIIGFIKLAEGQKRTEHFQLLR